MRDYPREVYQKNKEKGSKGCDRILVKLADFKDNGGTKEEVKTEVFNLLEVLLKSEL